ncbi:uncharacterized protein N7469_006458 [Penicillium citrinum]|uniref:Uncharacterized protein n=1 Tax=Penicillium citrinum TaxID=5077 RepID=A0A9W9NYP4_PENCI|nr:uncharacterized protein N7469_006458 [Penicillium citrinum]KAJ5231870.1 hypothetical protein N7469_006458 [Penicillium citrinum]
MYKGDFHHTNVKLHRKYGKIVQIAPGYYSVDDATAIKHIYGHGSQLVKGTWYKSWNFNPDPEVTNLFSERFPAHHSVMRRKVASLYSMTSLVSYEPYVDNCVDLLNAQFTRFAESGSDTDLAHWLQCYAFDVIGEITFGERFGFLDEGRDISHLMKTLDATLGYASYIGLYTWLRPIVDPIAAFVTKELYYVQEFADRRVLATRQTKMDVDENGPVYMAKKLIKAQMDGNKQITSHDIAATTGANVGAGSDTTGLSLSATLFYLYQHPHCLQKVREEIEQAGFVVEGKFTFQELQSLPYLQAVIKEALRLHPGTGYPMWRIVPTGGLTICGQVLPEGSNVGMNSWVAHRDKTIYGGDADEYKPERWLQVDADVEHTKAMEQSFMPFGYGARTCIGKNISLLEMNKLIPVLVKNFDIEFMSKGGAVDSRKSLAGRNRWFVKPEYLYAKITKRV